MAQNPTGQNKRNKDTVNFHRTEMQRELVMQKLREQGYRITEQRKMLLDVILQEECASCKEIYYRVASRNLEIGAATVYRMVNLLEEIGAISRKNMYKISCGMHCEKENACRIELDDDTIYQLSAQDWYQVISEGLRACGYLQDQRVTGVMAYPCAKECC